MTGPLASQTATVPGYRTAPFPVPRTACERRPDGTIVLRSLHAPVMAEQACMADFAAQWAVTRPGQAAFCAWQGDGWQALRWGELWRQVQVVAARLLALGLSAQQPLMVLSGNSLEQVVLMMAAELVGIPAAPVSPPYALQGGAFVRLREMHGLIAPGAVFVQSVPPYRAALEALGTPAGAVIAVDGAAEGQVSWASMVDRPLGAADAAAIAQAQGAIRPQDTGRIFFTSGSTGVPKGVPLTVANVRSMLGHILHLNEGLRGKPSVMLDWLPWHHAFGWLGNVGRTAVLGGTLYIDDGRPTPEGFGRTIAHLRTISPTIFATVPSAWALLVAELEKDAELARSFFCDLRYGGYGGAGLPRDVYDRIQRVAVQTVGERLVFLSGYGSTETTAQSTSFARESDDIGNIGVPTPGIEIKLVPVSGGDARYAVRTRGRHVFPGYLRRPDLTAQVFDEEGFYDLGDAVRLVDPADPAQGLRFAGRLVEDFKLSTGTWVRTGSVRLQLLAQCSPLLVDAVICGHDHDFVAALAWPNVAACQRLAPELAGLDAEALAAHPLVVAALQAKLRAPVADGVSARVRRVMLMAEPPSVEANEIADKGYINQAATRHRRAGLVAQLLQAEPSQRVAVA